MGTMQDYDPGETQEWVDSLKAVIAHVGPERARYLLGKLRNEALRAGVMPSFLATTPVPQHHPAEQEEKSSGNREIEHKIRSAIRWNAVAIILRANTGIPPNWAAISPASVVSTAVRHRLRSLLARCVGRSRRRPDLCAGPCRTGDLRTRLRRGTPYRRATQELPPGKRRQGHTVLPHPWLMPDFWQFPTVSMGLGPLMAIYQARFLKYLEGRGLAKTEGRKVWRSSATANATSQSRSAQFRWVAAKVSTT